VSAMNATALMISAPTDFDRVIVSPVLQRQLRANSR
jgi:hypothetical protein